MESLILSQNTYWKQKIGYNMSRTLRGKSGGWVLLYLIVTMQYVHFLVSDMEKKSYESVIRFLVLRMCMRYWQSSLWYLINTIVWIFIPSRNIHSTLASLLITKINKKLSKSTTYTTLWPVWWDKCNSFFFRSDTKLHYDDGMPTFFMSLLL